MKKLLFLLVGFYAINAQEKEEQTKPSGTINLHEIFLRAVKNKDIPLLEQALYAMEQADDSIEAGAIIPIIMKDMFSKLKSGTLLGVWGTVLVTNLYNLKAFKSSDVTIMKLIVKSFANLFVGHLVTYLLLRKNHKILNMLIDSDVCEKTAQATVLMERLRRQCLPLFFFYQ